MLVCFVLCLHNPSPRVVFCSVAMGISEAFPRSLRCIVVLSLLWVADHGVSWVSPHQVSVASRTVARVTRQAVMSPPPALKPPKEEPKVNPKRAEWLETWISFQGKCCQVFFISLWLRYIQDIFFVQCVVRVKKTKTLLQVVEHRHKKSL